MIKMCKDKWSINIALLYLLHVWTFLANKINVLFDIHTTHIFGYKNEYLKAVEVQTLLSSVIIELNI